MEAVNYTVFDLVGLMFIAVAIALAIAAIVTAILYEILDHLTSKKKIMDELIEKIIRMRDLQKRYFRGERDSMTLRACKQAERDVDTLVAQLTNQQPTVKPELQHPKLF